MFEFPQTSPIRLLLLTGLLLATMVAFILLRAADGFGNIRPRPGDSWIDFLNVVKYPPSMTFTLLMAGFDLTALWLLGRLSDGRARLPRLLAILGRAPLFCYVVHLFLYAGMAHVGSVTNIGIVPAIPYWLLGLLLLFPGAWWFSQFKRAQPIGSPLRLL